MMQVELVSPEKKVASLETDAVMLPGMNGDFTAMPGHVPVATALRPGLIRVRQGNGEMIDYMIAGGFAEVSNAEVSVLAERIAPAAEAEAGMFTSSIEALEASLEGADEVRGAEIRQQIDSLKHMAAGL